VLSKGISKFVKSKLQFVLKVFTAPTDEEFGMLRGNGYTGPPCPTLRSVHKTLAKTSYDWLLAQDTAEKKGACSGYKTTGGVNQPGVDNSAYSGILASCAHLIYNHYAKYAPKVHTRTPAHTRTRSLSLSLSLSLSVPLCVRISLFLSLSLPHVRMYAFVYAVQTCPTPCFLCLLRRCLKVRSQDWLPSYKRKSTPS
jgi:hypothetical protein